MATLPGLILGALPLSLPGSAGQVLAATEEPSNPAPLTHTELERISQPEPLPADLEKKLHSLLNTPFIYSVLYPTLYPAERSGSSSSPVLPLRVAAWNIERGFELPQIQQILSPQPLPATHQADPTRTPTQIKAGLEQKEWLAQSPIVLLSEVDYGMKRTDYRNTTLELAKSLHMQAAFAVEFVELAPFSQQARMIREEKLPSPPQLGEDMMIDPDRYLGLHGLAVLSRYPIRSARIVRLPQCYDWFHEEQKKLSQLEKLRQVASRKVFLETVLVEFRRGGRLALIVDLAVPDLPNKTLTVVATHLENRTKPQCRCQQMNAVLAQLREIDNPVVLGGDWNTSGGDISPTSVAKEVRNRLTSPRFWAFTALQLAVPVAGISNVTSWLVNFIRNDHDPTTRNIPILLPNPEKALFNRLKAYQFANGRAFDLRGDTAHSHGGQGGFMGNSNERATKGYVPTFSLERPLLKGWVGQYKLDWFAVKGTLTPAEIKANVYQGIYPVNGRTLDEINALYDKPVSDHTPITVDIHVTP